MRKFAVYLPQFHSFPENDEWWGKNFTEWVSVKNAEPLWEDHDQPKVPLNDKYYNLLDKDTVFWQTDLMHQYRIDGFTYYHYYFNGKLLMEKPAENLLKWTDVDQPFFFYWANHTWRRSWEGKSTVLIEQTYGDISDWRRHFDYLLPFFKDSRYEKKNNKPLFQIFLDFPEKEAMFKCFDDWCKEEGFDGIYLIETYNKGTFFPDDLQLFINRMSSTASALSIRQPSFGFNYFDHVIRKTPERVTRAIMKRIGKTFRIGKWILRYDGNRIWSMMTDATLMIREVLKSAGRADVELIPGFCFEWDNTPRHNYRGFIITPPDKEHFKSFMNSIISYDFLQINAWNEWAEGMMLEPTENNGYKYLEWIHEWVEDHER